MRVFVPATILLLTMALPATSRSAPPVQVPETIDRPLVSGDLADDAAVEGQPCDGQCEPGLLASVFGRFLNPSECDPHWSFNAEAVALQRTSTRNQTLFSEASTLTAPPELLNSRHLDFPTALGFELGAVRRGPCGWEWELGYFQIDGWNANYTSTGDSSLIADASGGGIAVVDGEAHYKSAIHLAELNLRRQWYDGLTLSVGFRAGELDELYSAYGTYSGAGPIASAPISLNINTYNYLYGFQTGADYEFYNMGGPLKISALCKAGIYGNSATQSSRLIEGNLDEPQKIDQTLAAHRYQAAFMGEAGAVATYQVTCHLSLRASCQAVWIEGVALAPEQISETLYDSGLTSIDTHGGIFYYGGGLGAELKF